MWRRFFGEEPALPVVVMPPPNGSVTVTDGRLQVNAGNQQIDLEVRITGVRPRPDEWQQIVILDDTLDIKLGQELAKFRLIERADYL